VLVATNKTCEVEFQGDLESSYFFFAVRFSTWVSVLPAAERAALVKRRSPITPEAAFAALRLVVPRPACASALAAAVFAFFELLVARVLLAFEAALLPVFSAIRDPPCNGNFSAPYNFNTVKHLFWTNSKKRATTVNSKRCDL
jgi:hypothetical protein